MGYENVTMVILATSGSKNPVALGHHRMGYPQGEDRPNEGTAKPTIPSIDG